MTLAPLQKEPKRLRFAVYDLEWYPHTYKLRLAGIRDESGYRSFETIRELMLEIFSPENHGMTFFAHAGGLCDVQFIYEEMFKNRWEQDGYTIDGAMSGSAAIRVTVRKGGLSWVLADSFWLFRDSLQRIGESMGMGKLKDYRCSSYPDCGHYCEARRHEGSCDHKPDSSSGCGMCIFYAPSGILKTYNERDCDILYEAIDRFQDEILDLGGQMRRTIAATALDLFRRKYLSKTISTAASLNDLIRPAYIASRVEVFRRRCSKANYYDFNSSFPSSMTKPQPGEYIGRVAQWNGETTWFARAIVEVPEMYVPPVAYRDAKTRAVYFPTGKWEGTFSGTDLNLLLECGGRILKLKAIYKFAEFDCLAQYVEEIYGRRKSEKDPFRRIVYKYLLNSLYGKFGESSEKRKLLVTVQPPESLKGYAEGHVETVLPGVYSIEQFIPCPHAHVAISASITSMSKALLTRALVKASASDPIYYADTDSLITTAELETSDELGDLKLEKTVDESGMFLAPKMYRLDATIRAKGFPKLTPKDFDSLVEGNGKRIVRMARLIESLKGDRVFAPTDKIFEKHVRLLSRPKRSWQGEDTRPWTMKELKA